MVEAEAEDRLQGSPEEGPQIGPEEGPQIGPEGEPLSGLLEQRRGIFWTEACWSDASGSVLCLHTGDWRTERPVFAKEKCNACGFCYIYCPTQCIGGDDDALDVQAVPTAALSFSGGTGADVLNVNAGPLAINAGTIGPAAALTVNANAPLTVNVPMMVAALNIADGVTVTAGSPAAVIRTTQLSLAGSAKLDIRDSGMIIDYDGELA